MVTIFIRFDPAANDYRREERFKLGNVIRSLAAKLDIWRREGSEQITIMNDDSMEIGSMTIRANNDGNDRVSEEEVAIEARNLISQHGLPAVVSAIVSVVHDTIHEWRGSSAKADASNRLGECVTHLGMALLEAKAAGDGTD